jgi:hypothetical protein
MIFDARYFLGLCSSIGNFIYFYLEEDRRLLPFSISLFENASSPTINSVEILSIHWMKQYILKSFTVDPGLKFYYNGDQVVRLCTCVAVRHVHILYSFIKIGDGFDKNNTRVWYIA